MDLGNTTSQNALPVRASSARAVGSSCSSTYFSKRSGNLWSRSSSGGGKEVLGGGEAPVADRRGRLGRRREGRGVGAWAGGGGGDHYLLDEVGKPLEQVFWQRQRRAIYQRRNLVVVVVVVVAPGREGGIWRRGLGAATGRGGRRRHRGPSGEKPAWHARAARGVWSDGGRACCVRRYAASRGDLRKKKAQGAQHAAQWFRVVVRVWGVGLGWGLGLGPWKLKSGQPSVEVLCFKLEYERAHASEHSHDK